MWAIYMTIKQGEVLEVEFFSNVRSEMGKKKPVIVINDNLIGWLPLNTLVQIEVCLSAFSSCPCLLKLLSLRNNGLSKESSIDCFQIRNFSVYRFVKKFALVDDTKMIEIDSTILKALKQNIK